MISPSLRLCGVLLATMLIVSIYPLAIALTFVFFILIGGGFRDSFDAARIAESILRQAIGELWRIGREE